MDEDILVGRFDLDDKTLKIVDAILVRTAVTVAVLEAGGTMVDVLAKGAALDFLSIDLGKAGEGMEKGFKENEEKKIEIAIIVISYKFHKLITAT